MESLTGVVCSGSWMSGRGVQRPGDAERRKLERPQVPGVGPQALEVLKAQGPIKGWGLCPPVAPLRMPCELLYVLSVSSPIS